MDDNRMYFTAVKYILKSSEQTAELNNKLKW